MIDEHVRQVLTAVRPRPRAQQDSRASDAYMTLLGVALVVTLLLAAVGRAFAAGGGLAVAAGWVPWLLGASWGCALLLLCAVVGPAWAGPAMVRWLLPTPLDRAGLLSRNVRAGVAVSCVVGAVGGSVVVLAAHAASVAPVCAGVVVGATGGAAVYLLALVVQCAAPPRVRLDLVSGGVLLVTCAAIVIGMRLGLALDLAPLGPPVAAAVFVASAVFIGWSTRRAGSWLRMLTVTRVAAGGALVATVTGSVMLLDEEMLQLRGDRARLARRSAHRSRGVAGPALVDVVVRDVVGCLRRWGELLARLSLVLVVWVVGAIFGSAAAAVACGVVAYLAGSSAALRLRVWLGSTSVWRSLPQSPKAVTLMLCVTPAVAAAGVGALAGLGGALPVGVAGAMGLAVAAGIVRRAGRPPMQLGLLIFTSAGALPVGVFRNGAYGVDLVALCTVAGILFGWWVAGVLAAACLTGTLLRARPGGEKDHLLPQRARSRLQSLGLLADTR